MSVQTCVPKVFISYSWDGERHKSWVKKLATRLRADGVDVTLDRWGLLAGDQVPQFMEKAIRENEYVIVICTPKYKIRSDEREGGVGYEGDIMTAEVLTGTTRQKFIPVLRSGSWGEAAPSWLLGSYYFDFSSKPFGKAVYQSLINALYGTVELAPPLGTRQTTKSSRIRSAEMPDPESKKPLPEFAREAVKKAFVSAFGSSEPIKILGIIADEIGTPRNDGSFGSSLYSVPFQLNHRPTPEWAQRFIPTWNSPPRYTTMHRPGIAFVARDRIILTETTVEEVEHYHFDTLKLVVNKVNEDMQIALDRERAVKAAQEEEARKRKLSAEEVARRIKFD